MEFTLISLLNGVTYGLLLNLVSVAPLFGADEKCQPCGVFDGVHQIGVRGPPSGHRALQNLHRGIADVAGKYYVPTLGSFVIYTVMILMLLWRPHGLFGRPSRH